MPSAWLEPRSTKGGTRWRVRFRYGGRESVPRFAGSFATKRDALARRSWVLGELAAMRPVDVRALAAMPAKSPTLEAMARRWQESRVDVSDSTRVLHRVALGRVVPILGDRSVDKITVFDVKLLVSTLTAAGKKRETIRKSVKYLAAVLDDCGIDPNPARDKRIRLPHEERDEIVPPTAEHVAAVYRLLAPAYRLPLLWLDWSGARVGSIDTLRVDDYD